LMRKKKDTEGAPSSGFWRVGFVTWEHLYP